MSLLEGRGVHRVHTRTNPHTRTHGGEPCASLAARRRPKNCAVSRLSPLCSLLLSRSLVLSDRLLDAVAADTLVHALLHAFCYCVCPKKRPPVYTEAGLLCPTGRGLNRRYVSSSSSESFFGSPPRWRRCAYGAKRAALSSAFHLFCSRRNRDCGPQASRTQRRSLGVHPSQIW